MFAGRELYPTVPAKAACLFRGLIKNHPLVDGNKRVAVTTVGTFLVLNGYWMLASNDQVRDYALRIARHHGDYPFAALLRWFRRHTELMDENDLESRRTFNRRMYQGGNPIEGWFTE